VQYFQIWEYFASCSFRSGSGADFLGELSSRDPAPPHGPFSARSSSSPVYNHKTMPSAFQWRSIKGHALARRILKASPLPYDPHDYQIEGICCSLDGMPLLAITPTGSGKTGFYTMYMLVVLAVVKDPTLCPG
jgi:hypothetical protein